MRRMYSHRLLFIHAIGYLIATTPEMQGVTLAVKPSSAAWYSNCWVSVTCSNLSAPGATATLDLIVDADGDGVVDVGQDYVFQRYLVQDGVTNRLGSTTYPDDDDMTNNRVIITKVSHFGGSFIGSTIVRVTDGSNSVTAAFTNTQPSTATYITGTVRDYSSDAPLAGAIAELIYYSDRQGYTPSQVTGANGQFKLYLPSGVTVSNVWFLVVQRPGYAGLYLDPDGYYPASFWLFDTDLHSGSNGIPYDLYLFSTNQPGIESMSGRCKDPTNGAAGPAIITFVGHDSWSAAVTDTNGNYFLPIHLNDMGFLDCDRGDFLPAGEIASVTVTGRMTNMDIVCPFPSALARGIATNRANGVPLTGAGVDFVAPGTYSYASTVSGGVYEVALASGVTYTATMAQDELQPMGYAIANRHDNIVMTGNSLTNLMFGACTGYLWSGVVWDTNHISLASGQVEISSYGSRTAPEYTATVNGHGYYEVLTTTGTFKAATSDFDDYVEMAYSNRFPWTGIADPIPATTAGVKNINFILSSAAPISGTVLGTGLPVNGITVTAYEKRTNALEWRVDTTSAPDGTYQLDVPPGTSYVVSAGSPRGCWWTQYYDHKASTAAVNLVTTSFTTPATNINFDLVAGLGLFGRIANGDGLPMSNVHMVVWLNDGPGTNQWLDDQWSGSEGDYHAVVKGGANYVVSTLPDPGNTNEWAPRQWYRDSFSPFTATLVTGNAGEVVSNIDFTLPTGYRIEGLVCHADASTPLMSGSTTPFIITNNTRVPMDTVATRPDGWYSACVPANVPVILLAGDTNGLHAPEYWDNQYDALSAVIFLTNATQFRRRIDLALHDYTADTDGDGVRDYEEDSRPDGRYTAGEDASNLTNRDTDADGSDDFSEQIAGTSPTNSLDRLAFQDVTRSGMGIFIFEWPGITGRSYDLYRTDNLMETGHWSIIFSTNAVQSGALTGVDISPAGNGFYKLGVRNQP